MSHPNDCLSSTKTIYLIRHGVARHNVRGPHGEKPNLLDPSYTDPELIRQGEIQASVLGEQMRTRGFWWQLDTVCKRYTTMTSGFLY